jgi:translation initiation factor 3 subunit C
VQDFLQKALANKDAKKKMSPTNAKALNSMRQRLRKHNLTYADQIEAFRENPVSSDADASGDEDAESSEESGAVSLMKTLSCPAAQWESA